MTLANTVIKIPTTEPFPFIFMGKNFALAKYGATIIYSVTGSVTTVDSSYPVENIIDGSRNTFCQINKICPFTQDSNYLDLKIDMSSSIGSGDTVNCFAIESDPNFPILEVRVWSYTDQYFSTGATEHHKSEEEYFSGKYQRGTFSRADCRWVHGWQDYRLCPTRHLFFTFFKQPIESDHPYVRVRIQRGGKNSFGNDFSYDHGMWQFETASPNGPTIITSDPNPYTYGDNNNHALLNLSGKSADQSLGARKFTLDPEDTFQLTFYEKKSGIGDTSVWQYNVFITYYDIHGDSLGPQQKLYTNLGTENLGSWGRQTVLINYKGTDGIRYSGEDDAKHVVPEKFDYVSIQLVLKYDGSHVLSWKIDDWQLIGMKTNHGVENYDLITFDDRYMVMPVIYHVDGKARIRRIGFFNYKFSTTRIPHRLSRSYDLGERAMPNPRSISDETTGKIVQLDWNQRVIKEFIPAGGIKQNRTVQIICNEMQKKYLIDLYGSGSTFSLVDMQNEFGEYILTPTGLRFVSADGEDEANQEDHLWAGTLTLREV